MYLALFSEEVSEVKVFHEFCLKKFWSNLLAQKEVRNKNLEVCKCGNTMPNAHQ